MPVVNRDALPIVAGAHEFEGYLHGGAATSLIFVEAPPGSGPRLHRHPYAELFVIEEGEATFTLGEETILARAGQIVIAPAGVPHTFVNTGAGTLRQLDIHTSDRFVTEWLES